MRDFYEERKRSSLFSWREFSKLAGFTSPNYIQLVCEGKSRLSKTGVEKVATAMGLVASDREYFLAMERFGDAKSDSKKIQAFNEMQKIAKENRLRVVDGEAFKYFESWVNPVIRELAPIMPGAKPLELARNCYPVVSATEVRQSLDFMVHADFLKKVGEESTEVIIAGKGGDRAETVYEIADLAYHVMVLMVEMGIRPEEIRRELASRHIIDHKVKQEKMA